MKVKDVMHKVIAIDGKENLKEAAKIMSSKHIGSLVVLKNDKIVGIITEHDIISNISSLGSQVSNVMSKQVVTIDEKDNLGNAASLMAKHKIKRLPAMKGRELSGIITITDLIANSEFLEDTFIFD